MDAVSSLAQLAVQLAIQTGALGLSFLFSLQAEISATHHIQHTPALNSSCFPATKVQRVHIANVFIDSFHLRMNT